RLVVDELLDAMERCLAALSVQVGRLLPEQPVDVRIASVDVRTAGDDEGLEAARGVAERPAETIDEILQLLLLVALEERRPFERADLDPDARRLQISGKRIRPVGSRCVAPETAGIEAVRVAGLGEQPPRARRIVRVRGRLPEIVETLRDDAPDDPGESERERLIDGLAIHRVIRGESDAPIGPW